MSRVAPSSPLSAPPRERPASTPRPQGAENFGEALEKQATRQPTRAPEREKEERASAPARRAKPGQKPEDDTPPTGAEPAAAQPATIHSATLASPMAWNAKAAQPAPGTALPDTAAPNTAAQGGAGTAEGITNTASAALPGVKPDAAGTAEAPHATTAGAEQPRAATLPAQSAPQPAQQAAILPVAVAGAGLAMLGEASLATQGPATLQGLATTAQPTRAMPMDALPLAIAAETTGGARTFTIRLDPAELGEVQIRLAIGEDGVPRAHLIVERPATLHQLLQDAPRLEQALNAAGGGAAAGADVTFSLRQDGGGQPMHQPREPAAHGQPAANAPALMPTPRALLHHAATAAGTLDLML